MTLLIDSTVMTSLIAVPLQEGWIETDVPFQIVPNLPAGQVGRGDVALISGPEATHLASTHFIDPAVAVVAVAMSTTLMRTPVRPDGIVESAIRMLDVTPTGEALLRALLRPYYGITATAIVTDPDDPIGDEAQVVVVDNLQGLQIPESEHEDDLAKSWFVMTGAPVVHAVSVIGVEAEVRGADDELALLRQAVELGVERRRDVRRILSGDEELDRDMLVELTNGLRFDLTSADRQSLRNLVSRGSWGSRFGRQLPAFRDEVTGA